MRRGQSSFEFAILLGFLILVFLGFLLAVQSRSGEQQMLNREGRYAQLVGLVEQELLLASGVKSGYYRAFSLPVALSGETYRLNWSEEDDGLIVRGSAAQNDYVRFVSVNATLVQAPAGLTLSDGRTPCPVSSSLFCCPYDLGCLTPPRVVLTTNRSGLYLRKDCAWQECGDTPCGDIGACASGVVCDENLCKTCKNADGDDYSPDGGACGVRDCDDTDPRVYPGATERCNAIDDDCDTSVDEGLTDATACDQDGECAGAFTTCVDGVWGSCSRLPSPELCDGLDNDCDDSIDEPEDIAYRVYFKDYDGDLFGNRTNNRSDCKLPTGYVVDDDDCNDRNALINPVAVEECNGLDDDCDPETPDGSGNETFYLVACDGADADLCKEGVYRCIKTVSGASTTYGFSCDDLTAANVDTTCDGVDQDCSGYDACCTDTDGGLFPFLLGAATNATQTTLTDSCVVATKTFTEYSCVGSLILLTTGACTSGTYGGTASSICYNGACCTPAGEVCNDRDDDCDGVVDDGSLCSLSRACCNGACCAAGQVCYYASGACCTPSTAACSGLDFHYVCGDVPSGCGTDISCGTCSFGFECQNHQCVSGGGDMCTPPCDVGYACDLGRCVTNKDFCDRHPSLCDTGGNPIN